MPAPIFSLLTFDPWTDCFKDSPGLVNSCSPIGKARFAEGCQAGKLSLGSLSNEKVPDCVAW